MPNAIFVAESNNHKIASRNGGKVSATYASIDRSCPRSCALLKTKECYAQNGHVGLVVNRLSGGTATALQVAQEEATLIDKAFKGGPVPQDGAQGGRDLRLHVSGDARTVPAAKVLAGAVARWAARGGGAVWAYSHAWRKVPRKAWGPTSVLASVDSLAEVPAAKSAGYAPARYMAEFPSEKAWEENGTRWIPCPAQTKGVGCADCRLCFNADALASRDAGIAFAAHGCKATSLKRRLTVLREGG